MKHIFSIKYITPHYESEIFILNEIYLFILLGLFCGSVASLFLYLYTKFIYWKRENNHNFVRNRYVYVLVITFIITVLSFPHHSFHFGFKEVIMDLINIEDFSKHQNT